MKQNNRQISPFGRSTEEKQAGLSLLRPRLIEIIGDNYVYFNEILQNIYTTVISVVSKVMSPFLKRLTFKKFAHVSLQRYEVSCKLDIKIDFILKRPFCQPKVEHFWLSF